MMAMRWVGVVTAFGFMALSVAINWRYGMSAGRDHVDQLIFSATSLLVDIAKATTPFFFFYSLASKRWMTAGIAAMFWLICTCYSLLSVAGFIEANSAAMSGTLKTRHEAEASLRAALTRKKAERDTIETVMSPAIAAAKMTQLKSDRRWATSKHCTELKNTAERKFCIDVANVEMENVKSSEAARIERNIESLEDEIATLTRTGALAYGDPRVAFVVRHLNWQPDNVGGLLALLFLSVLEIGSGLGLFMALGQSETGEGGLNNPSDTGHVRSRRVMTRGVVVRPAVSRHDDDKPGGDDQEGEQDVIPEIGDVAKFACARLRAALGKSVTLDKLHVSYLHWCEEKHLAALERVAFDQQFIEMAKQVGFKSVKRGRCVAFLDLEVAKVSN